MPTNTIASDQTTYTVTVPTCDCGCHNDVTEEELSQVEKSKQQIKAGIAITYKSIAEYEAHLMQDEILDAIIDIVERYGYQMGGGIKDDPEDGGYILQAHLSKKEQLK